MNHVVITGGAGFIGSHLCEAFLDLGYAVTAIDNFVTGRKENLGNALKNPAFDLVEWDVTHPVPDSEIRFLSHLGLAGLLHLAQPSNPLKILEADSIGTRNTVDLARRYQARYLLASSAEVYGDPLVHPQTEDYAGNVHPASLRAEHEEAKRFAETYVSAAARHSGLNAAIARIFETYGPRMRPDSGQILPELFLRALSGTDIPIYGSGERTHSLCSISDLVRGIVKLFESEVHVPVNLGNPDEWSEIELARIIKEMAAGSSRITPLSAPGENPRRIRPDIARAQKLLDWRPQVTLHSGLESTFFYFRDRIRPPHSTRAAA